MDYQRLLQGILDIGEAMLMSGAENFRIDDSLYRICKSYGFVKYDVFVIPSNIQITVETPDGEILTQIRHIESTDTNFDRLDYLNNLCRYVCQNKPDDKELREKYLEVMRRPQQKPYTKYFAAVMGWNRICRVLWMQFCGCNRCSDRIADDRYCRRMVKQKRRESDDLQPDPVFFIRSDHYRVCPDGAWKSSGEDYDRHRYAADQWTWHNERYPGAFAERFHFRNDQYHEFDAGSCRNCIRYGACDDHAERCISGRLYFKSQYTNPADILYDCLYWICILV